MRYEQKPNRCITVGGETILTVLTFRKENEATYTASVPKEEAAQRIADNPDPCIMIEYDQYDYDSNRGLARQISRLSKKAWPNIFRPFGRGIFSRDPSFESDCEDPTLIEWIRSNVSRFSPEELGRYMCEAEPYRHSVGIVWVKRTKTGENGVPIEEKPTMGTAALCELEGGEESGRLLVTGRHVVDISLEPGCYNANESGVFDIGGSLTVTFSFTVGTEGVPSETINAGRFGESGIRINRMFVPDVKGPSYDVVFLMLERLIPEALPLSLHVPLDAFTSFLPGPVTSALGYDNPHYLGFRGVIVGLGTGGGAFVPSKYGELIKGARPIINKTEIIVER